MVTCNFTHVSFTDTKWLHSKACGPQLLRLWMMVMYMCLYTWPGVRGKRRGEEKAGHIHRAVRILVRLPCSSASSDSHYHQHFDTVQVSFGQEEFHLEGCRKWINVAYSNQFSLDWMEVLASTLSGCMQRPLVISCTSFSFNDSLYFCTQKEAFSFSFHP